MELEESNTLIEKFMTDVDDLLEEETAEFKRNNLQRLRKYLEDYKNLRNQMLAEQDSAARQKIAVKMKEILLRIHSMYKGISSEPEKAQVRVRLNSALRKADVTEEDKDLQLLAAVVDAPPI